MQSTIAGGGVQYLTFKLREEVFAFDIARVREVLDFTTLTKVPNSQDFVLGVINLRGLVVPIVDLRLAFGMTKTEKTAATCVIIAEVAVNGETSVLGMLADSVNEVLNLEPDQIQPAPKIGTRLRTSFIAGLGKINEQFIIVLDIDRVFSSAEISSVQRVQSSLDARPVS